jgi:hypothetical protein
MKGKGIRFAPLLIPDTSYLAYYLITKKTFSYDTSWNIYRLLSIHS